MQQVQSSPFMPVSRFQGTEHTIPPRYPQDPNYSQQYGIPQPYFDQDHGLPKSTDPLYKQESEQYRQNQNMYIERLRQDNLELIRENNILQHNAKIQTMKLNEINQQQQSQLTLLEGETKQQKRTLGEIERNYQEETKISDMHQQEIYRNRLQYEDMKNNLEKVIRQKENIIQDMTIKLQEAQQQRDKEAEEKQILEQRLLQLGEDLEDTLPLGQNIEDRKSSDQSSANSMSYKKVVGGRKLENENLQLKEQLRQKNNECLDLQNKLLVVKQKFEKQLEEEKRNERKRDQFKTTMNSMPYQAENEDLKRKKNEAEGALKKVQEDKKQMEQQIRKQVLELEGLQKKLQQYEEGEMQKQEKVNENNEVLKVSDDRHLLEGMIGLMHYLRESTVEMMFEVFVRSANQAHQRKTSSLIIFSINLKELKEKNVRGFVIVLFLYKKMKSLIKLYYPNYGKAQILDDKQQHKSQIEKNKIIGDSTSFRDEINQWLEKSINQCKHKKNHQEKGDINRDLNYLFRLLALKYRLKYPLKGDPYRADLDLKIKLENKITSAMLMCFVDE